jgi:hypothetical protein
MPYITQGARDYLNGNFTGNEPESPGELNYLITMLVDGYLQLHGANYARISEVIGALECAKLEVYRRIAAPYEDKKMRENGDVYSPKLITRGESA